MSSTLDGLLGEKAGRSPLRAKPFGISSGLVAYAPENPQRELDK